MRKLLEIYVLLFIYLLMHFHMMHIIYMFLGQDSTSRKLYGSLPSEKYKTIFISGCFNA